MKCPYCRSNQTEVYNSRGTKFGNQIWRRRRCGACHEAFTTYECPDLGFLRVTSQSGSHSSYSRAKLYSSINTALGGHTTSAQTSDAVTDTVESKLLDLKLKQIPCMQISQIILTTLKHYDSASFLRYLASHADLRSKSELKRQLKSY